MRRTPLILSCLALSAALALTGCSSSDTTGSASSGASASAGAAPAPADCSTVTIDSDSEALPEVSGDPGVEPTLTWTGQAAPANLTVKTLIEGDGEVLEQESDMVVAAYAGWQWDSHETFDSSYATGAPVNFGLNQVIDGWRCGLLGHKVGDRLVMSIPASMAYGDDSTSGAPATGPLVFVVEITDAITLTGVEGASATAVLDGQQAVADRGLTVTGELGTPPSISVNEGAEEPVAAETIVLATGTGAPITETDTVAMHMAYTTWDNSMTESTWDMGTIQTVPMSTAVGMGGLVGVPLGSRVVVLQPGDPMTGSQALAWVIDVARTV